MAIDRVTIVAFAALAIAGCAIGERYVRGRGVASETLGCPDEQLETVFAHSYNLAAGDEVYRGCGRDVIVRCATTSAATFCHPVFVTDPQ